MDAYDKASKLKIGNEDLEQAKFFLTLLNRVAVRVGAEYETPVNVQSTDAIKDYSIDSVDITNNTELEIDVPKDCKYILIKSRALSRLRISTTTSETDDDGKYLSIGKGGHYSLGGSKLEAVKKLYCRVTTGDTKLEILTAI